ncbi:glutathione S-transferase 1-like [Gigantopelta aegis]|uniref:glutathione S-transferase 1-like n=1 Tax=Gigantopelta aegis TaxID=1735272 RepID=UPI001B887DB5|nr:glutathione S-transferase 1-like [Gigantopelta aegis]
MSSYKLYYFDARGRAELMRLIFAYKDVTYEDVRYTRETWPSVKPSFPTGQLPCLEVDGKKLSQSIAITNFLARKYDLYGADIWQQARIDEVIQSIMDFITAWVRAVHEKDETKKEELKKKVGEEDYPKFCAKMEMWLKENGEHGVFVGNDITVADMAVFDVMWSTRKHSVNNSVFDDDKYKLLMANFKKIETHPKIAAWIEKRPDTTV